MINVEERARIIALVKREVVPAIGCTEPIAVALCVAKATETLGRRPEKITVLLSANILKNAMGVGIPGTGMIGLPIAVALGALVEMKKQGLSAPDDIAVVGFANEPFDEWITPSLTSVEQYSCRMGELAAKMLIDKIDGETPGDIVIEPQLIVRESSRKNKE